MILIADGGSTKTSWVLLDQTGEVLQFETEGYHPFFVGSDYIRDSLEKKLPEELKESFSIVLVEAILRRLIASL